MDFRQIFQIVFGMAGGLSLFIFGMNMMSESLQKVAGRRMRVVLETLTKNPVLGVLAGALVTAVLQSSSATTVLVIGFISAGLMSLPQGISVIFGANIGTTITAQLIAFKISDYILLILAIGFLISFVARKSRGKNTGLAIFAFALLFVGVETMGNAMKPLANSAVFISLMQNVSGIPVLGVLVGIVMTLVVQSSSATIAVLQNFACQAGVDGVSSIIGLSGAIPILLGDNIGTTITALFASIGQSRNARRAAVAHSIFNIGGAFLFIWIIPIFACFVRFISPKGAEVQVIARQIANAHMAFNVFNTLIWLPLVPLMVRIVNFVVRDVTDEKSSCEEHVIVLDKKLLAQPTAAIVLIQNEIMRAFIATKKSIGSLEKVFTKRSVSALERTQKRARVAREIEGSLVASILSLFSAGTMTEVQSMRMSSMLCVLNDIARINSQCEGVIPIARQYVERNIKFFGSAISEISKGLDRAKKVFYMTTTMLVNRSPEVAGEIINACNKIRFLERKYMRVHLKRMDKNLRSLELSEPLTLVFHCITSIAILCMGIAEEILEAGEVEEVSA